MTKDELSPEADATGADPSGADPSGADAPADGAPSPDALWEAEQRMLGFPPEPSSLVTLDNWQDPPNQRWAFQHMRELIPSQQIAAPEGEPSALPAGPWAGEELDALPVHRLGDIGGTVGDVLAQSWTDAVMVLQEGQVVLERYGPGMTPDRAHLLMSVSKSIVGCVAATLVEDGLLDLQAPVNDYVPELAGTGYDKATLRQVLDMRTGALFREAYTDPDAEVRVMERSMGWRSLQAGDPEGTYAYLATLGSEGPHGGSFTYRSSDTDLLGWVCERASGVRMADLVGQRIWGPLGAEHDAYITCDRVGTAIHDGGVSATARDLARFGQMLLDDGRSAGRQVVPPGWVDLALTADEDVQAAFAASDNDTVLPGGWYRNQFWMIPVHDYTVLLCLGIHGQMVYVDRTHRTVCIKLSSWPDPQNAAYLIDTLRAFRVVARHLTDR